MIALLFLLGVGIGAGGGWLGSHLRHRARTANTEMRADMCDWHHEAADRLAHDNQIADLVIRDLISERTPRSTP